MIDKEDKSFLKNLETNIHSKFKRKIFTIVLNAEFNILMNLLKDIKILRTIFLREMHGFATAIQNNKNIYFNKNLDINLIFPKKNGEKLEINEFMINNINSNKIFNNNYVYKIELIYLEGWEKYKKVIFRHKLLNKDNFNVKKISNSENIINSDKHNLKLSNFIDSILSFYIDNKDNSTVIINEKFYDLNENVFSRFYDFSILFFKKIKNFVENNLKIYFCNESILINRSILQTFNSIMSRKVFNNKRFELKEIQKFDEEISIYVDIRDKIYPDSVFRTRCHILKLSDISCFASIVSLIDIKYFNLERFTTLKAAISVSLKLLKKNIEKEMIDS